jgi:hypothetical protein
VLTLLRFLVIFFCLNVIVRFVRALWHAMALGPERREAPPAGVTLVRDRVCNTFLPRERALVATIDGREEYFCSEECRTQAQIGAPPAGPIAER